MPAVDKVYLKRTLSKGKLRFYNMGLPKGVGRNYGSDEAIAKARFKEWQDAQTPSRAIGGPTLDDAIAAYYATKIGKHAFQTRAPRTREIYRLYIEQVRARLGHLALIGIDRRVGEKIRDNLAAHPAKCNQTLAVLQIVFNHAIRSGTMKGKNPMADVERVESKPRSEVWDHRQIDVFLAAARPSLRLAALLLLYTAQRPSDVLAMTKGQVVEQDGQLEITLRQQKTGTLVGIPVHPELERALRERLADPSGGVMLVPSPTGLAWTRRNFSRAWDQVRRAAGLPPLQRRDLRRTAVVNLALAGCTIPDIQSITGHHTSTIDDMLRIYLPRRIEVARGAMAKWAAAPRPKLDNVIQLATTAPKRTR